jgi:molecular chaperone GrpE
VAEHPPKEPTEPTVRVVDRRWWARKEDGAPVDTGEARKPSYIEDLEHQLGEQGAQLQAYAAEHRRALEEFEQVKVRLRRDVAKEVERGKRALLVEMLDIVDNLDRAISSARKTASPSETSDGLLRGVELVRDQFLVKLTGFGVSRVAALGQPFDAGRHEAVTTTPVADAAQDGVVVAVVKDGYAIGDEILRPANVVVGRLESGA